MTYCSTCGSKLIEKEKINEGPFPYCPSCEEYRFPVFNTAVSMIVLNPDKTKVLMIQQYGKPFNILVAGYVDKGECLEEALCREVKEEIGLNVISYTYNRSEYFPKSNTVICNFACVVQDESLEHVSTWEVDHAQWYPIDEALQHVKPESLAKRFLLSFFEIPLYFIPHLNRC